MAVRFDFVVKCYFQRCQKPFSSEWVCNYHGQGVEVECTDDEICFEENSVTPFGSRDRFLIERNCRSTAIINGELVNLKDWFEREFGPFPPGIAIELVFQQTHGSSAIAGGMKDLCNNILYQPPSFRIAENGNSE